MHYTCIITSPLMNANVYTVKTDYPHHIILRGLEDIPSVQQRTHSGLMGAAATSQAIASRPVPSRCDGMEARTDLMREAIVISTIRRNTSQSVSNSLIQSQSVAIRGRWGGRGGCRVTHVSSPQSVAISRNQATIRLSSTQMRVALADGPSSGARRGGRASWARRASSSGVLY